MRCKFGKRRTPARPIWALLKAPLLSWPRRIVSAADFFGTAWPQATIVDRKVR
jgi:hypothetical protein